jgi:tRNA U34 5-methylaminomethyl-2-thiouridine-forming methyltransferase MnmC
LRVQPTAGYKIVQLVNGTYSVHSLCHRETFHPVIGPVAEAEALYVNQLRLPARLRAEAGEFVIWDVGLGAAANALTVVRAMHQIHGALRLVSFDNTIEPLQFALQHAELLGYLEGYRTHLEQLIDGQRVSFTETGLSVEWQLCLGDFPSLLVGSEAQRLPKPHAIMFDAFSPAKNPAMWTQPLFAHLYRLLDPNRPCALPTYSRSTMLRVSLLLAGFFVGSGHATGEKEETTIAANTLDLISEPLDCKWLQRARNSTSAEPMWEPVYRQAPLSSETWQRLQAHPQFASATASNAAA